MREIKFRAWDKENNSMEYSENPPSFGFWKWYAYDNTTPLMQYTGLKDKNGTEIYEGDVISFETDPAHEVKWNNDFCCWTCWEDGKLGNEGEIFDWCQMKKLGSKYYIIHGNIHQNPELI